MEISRLEFLSTRLFPKNLGADRYNLTGIAELCDWVVLSDRRPPLLHLHKNNLGTAPDTVYLSLRQCHVAIPYFFEHVLPQLTKPFVLVSGSEDVTIPHQIDKRWPAFSALETERLKQLAEHPFLVHWYAENLDEQFSNKVSPIPLGMVYADGRPPEPLSAPHVPPLSARIDKAFCSHRVREGEQWEVRRQVSNLACTEWRELVTSVTEELSEKEFLQHVAEHRFVICAQGGGLDPSPKAWQALQYGAIPIIKDSATAGAYRNLPVVIVPDWTADTITQQNLTCWYKKYRHFFDDEQLRSQTLQKLTLDYWWRQIQGMVNGA